MTRDEPSPSNRSNELARHIETLATALNAGNAAALRRRRPQGECSYCDQYGDDPMMPRHTASERCESGKRPHCTCDTCF